MRYKANTAQGRRVEAKKRIAKGTASLSPEVNKFLKDILEKHDDLEKAKSLNKSQ